MTTIHDILAEFRDAATSNRDLGDRFERLMLQFLKTDPLYQDQFSEVWMWMDFPKRAGEADTGIDLVAEKANGDGYCAIQCKFYDPNHTLDKQDIDSFFTASGKSLYTSRLIVSTTDNWSKHAQKALENQQIPVSRLRVQDLADSAIDWSGFSLKHPEKIKLRAKKQLRPHQTKALEKVITGFETGDRGKLIMACGTGKTFTSLKIAEKFVPKGAIALFLVPSISLLSQTLREWTAESARGLHCVAVCSDKKVGKKSDSEDIHTYDLALPATTDAQEIIKQVQGFQGKKDLTVIFSTYQSIQAIAAAQKGGLPEFDLIICDEAHRTTGVTLSGVDESHFVKVHDQDFIKGKKRLYMTATPRIFKESTKVKAQENEALLCSMDDQNIYGDVFHTLTFSEAIALDLLTDYKVMILGVDKQYVNSSFQGALADRDQEIKLNDATKIVGCWNGLSKRMTLDLTGEMVGDLTPMRRAVAFCNSIADSKNLIDLFAAVIGAYRQSHPDEEILECEVDHVDGSMNALERNKKLDWLKEDTTKLGKVCRILSNARCLSEGVDVPALDAVIFLNPRKSYVDIIQSVGRVMRKSPDKQYGYIILPVAIAANVSPEEALREHEYKVVWQVLEALRSHDDRFDNTINKIELNNFKPTQIVVDNFIGDQVTETGDSSGYSTGNTPNLETSRVKEKVFQYSLDIPEIEKWRDAIYTKIVEKCGTRTYWEKWAKDAAAIAENYLVYIRSSLENPVLEHRQIFDEFLAGLRENLNPSISQDDAIEMLSQHLVTKPIFDALFEKYPFAELNPVSQSMQRMLDVLAENTIDREMKQLEGFFTSVRERANGIDNAQGKQKIIIELYDKFFRNAFPKMAERLGIVYTPVEVVDFIIRSADVALKQEFGVGLTDEGVHILDPFTGTGTFIVRLLQSGLIKPDDLTRKFKQELHANEIVLLAYYIAAINIESAYHDLAKTEYSPFDGIILTDTFQLFEPKNKQTTLLDKIFPENHERAKRQQQNDIRVIVGNPPYSAGQNSENDGNKNLKYDNLDQRIRETYAEFSTATNKNSLYDSYIRGIRWASDRMKDKGIIAYVTNGSFIDNNAMDGLRKSLTNEFSSIYCFNLRGNARTSGEDRRKEKGNVFGEGTRTPVAITLLIKNPKKTGKCELFYHDIGDYLSREDKLEIIQSSMDISRIQWEKMKPNDSYDWINQRDPAFDKFISLGDKKDPNSKTIFDSYSRGIATSRDAWCYNFSSSQLTKNMTRMINFYSQQVESYQILKGEKPKVEDFIDNDPQKISWSRGLKFDLGKNRIYDFDSNCVVSGMYRPYVKQKTYFSKYFNDMVYQMPKFFPNENLDNLVISVTGVGVTKDFNVFIANVLPDVQLQANGQCFPLYRYEKVEKTDQTSLFTETEGYTKKENIPDEILEDFRQIYSTPDITKEDIFYYVYGILHSPEYKTRFAADLKKMLPRIPYAEDFWAFSKAGRDLAHWHLNYETIDPYPLVEYQSELYLDDDNYRVEKMVFGNRNKDKTTIIYNSKITLSGIPLEAYNYIVNGKSALEWIIERYQYTKDKDSGITNDPNDWSEEPRYILDLVKRIVRVSVETVKIVNSLPPLNEKKEINSHAQKL